MQHIFTFTRLAVVVRHWYEIGEHDEEHGARVELRQLVGREHRGSASAAQPIELDRIYWRADIFDLIGAQPGNRQRAHYHAHFDGVEPIGRQWDADLTADAFRWLADRLRAVDELVDHAADGDVTEVRRLVPDIVTAARACAAETCSDGSECLRRTRDTVAVVGLMGRELRPDNPGDPRLALTTDDR